MRLTLSPKAEKDLIDIADSIALDNPLRAVSFVRELRASCVKLRDFPLIGVERPDLAEGCRMLVYKKYLAFYRIAGDMIVVDHLTRGDRDLESLYEPKEEKSHRSPRSDFTKPAGSKEK